MTATMENYLKSHLGSVLSPVQLNTLLKTTAMINQLPPDIRAIVIRIFADGYKLQMRITTGFSAIQFLVIGLIWKNPQISVIEKKKDGESE